MAPRRSDVPSVFVIATISIRVATFLVPVGTGADARLVRAIDIFQIGTLMWSLLANLSATSIIGHKAW